MKQVAVQQCVRQHSSLPWQPTSFPWQPTSFPWQPTSLPWQPTSLPWQPSSLPWQPSSLPWQPTSLPCSGRDRVCEGPGPELAVYCNLECVLCEVAEAVQHQGGLSEGEVQQCLAVRKGRGYRYSVAIDPCQGAHRRLDKREMGVR